MANPAHVAVVRAGLTSLRSWRHANPTTRLDLREAILEGLDLSHTNLAGADLHAAVLDNCNISSAGLDGADLSGASLIDAKAERATFKKANLKDGILTRIECAHGDFSETDLEDADLVDATLSHALFTNAIINQADFSRADLSHSRGWNISDIGSCELKGAVLDHVALVNADFSGRDLERTKFRNCDLTDAKFVKSKLRYADFTGARLPKALLINSDLHRAVLKNAHLNCADLSGANLDEATLTGADVQDTKNVDEALHLETTIIASGDVTYVDSLTFSPLNTRLSWEKLRTVGKLPLFAASYVALIGIPIFFYGLDFYNQKIDVMRSWAAQELMEPGPHPFASLVLARLNTAPIPDRSLWILLAAVFLGIASTIYTVFSPPRVREFSQDQWRDQLNRPAFHYLAHSWQSPILRIVSATFYAIGGLIAVFLILERVVDVFSIIVRNM